jgi:hypothetical protein
MEQNLFVPTVCDIVGTHVTSHGFSFREDIRHRSVRELPAKEYLVYTKPVRTIGFAHIAFAYSPTNKPQQSYYVLILRYSGLEPVEAFAVPMLGKPRSNIAGYLGNASHPPLPLTGTPGSWSFATDAELREQMTHIAGVLCDSIIPWLEDVTSSQFIYVHKADIVEAFEQYVNGTWEAKTAYDTVKGLFPEGYYIEAGDESNSALVYEINTILRQRSTNPHPKNDAYPPPLLHYLRTCLRDETKFDYDFYRRMQNELYFGKRED